MDEVTVCRLEEILRKYSLPPPSSSHAEGAVRDFCKLAIEQNRNGTPVNVACVVEVLHCFSSLPHSDVEKLLQLLYVSRPSESGLAKLCELLRVSGNKYLPARLHYKALSILKSIIEQDSPPAIKFPGDLRSYAQLPSISLPCAESYTLTMWCKFSGNPINSDTRLFRCRSPSGGIECALAEYHPDGRCLFRLRATAEQQSPIPRESEDVHGTMFFTQDKWLLLSFVHIAGKSSSRPFIRVYVDGTLEVEHDLPYPFLNSPQESSWTIGSGMRGVVAGLALYSEGLSPHLLSLLAESGPYMPALDIGVPHPQGSFDTGHCVLGTQLTKGQDATNACKARVVFCFTPLHFTVDSLLPVCSAGQPTPDYIEMTSRWEESETARLPFLTGLCDIDVNLSWTQAWLNIGGTNVMLYLLWDYAMGISRTGRGADEGAQGVAVSNLHGAMDLVTALLSRSSDARDLFLQEHGFHVLSLALSRLTKNLINKELVDKCLLLVGGMLSDMHTGDGITAALQGLLLEFKIWEHASVDTKRHLLSAVADLTAVNAEALYRSTGVQFILDILDKHCRTPEATANNHTDSNVVELADAGHRLLCIAMDAALQFSHQSGGRETLREMEYLLLALENTTCSEVAERLLKTVEHFRFSAPRALRLSLKEIRFAETTVLRLLCDRSVMLSTGVRRMTLTILLWDLQQSLGDLPDQVLEMRHCFSVLYIPTSDGYKTGDVALEGSRKYRERRETVARLKTLLKPVERLWLTVNMLVTVLEESLGNEGWVYSSSNQDDVIALTPAADVLDVFLYDGPLGTIDTVLTLPLVATLLPRAPLQWCQRVLMSISVLLKTNDSHLCLLSLLPDISWIRHFLNLAVIGEVRRTEIRSVDTDDVRLVYSQDGIDTSFKNEERCSDWTSVSPFGEVAVSSDECDAASTCMELALDALSQLLLYKLRYFGPIAWESFKMLRSCLHIPSLELYRDKLLFRICSLCLQKLCRSTQTGWNSEMMSCTGHFLALIEERQYCGNDPVMKNESLRRDLDTADLLGLDCSRVQTSEERQMFMYVMEMIASLRRSGEKSDLGRNEVKVVLTVLRIFMGCLHCISEETADRMCTELLLTLSYIAEKWSFVQEDVFRDVVLGILSQLQSAIKDNSICEATRDRYKSAVVTIVQYFVQLRFTGIGANLSLPAHVMQIVDTLGVAEGCGDVDSIFMLLHMYLKPDEHNTDTISFADEGDLVAVFNAAPEAVVSSTDHNSVSTHPLGQQTDGVTDLLTPTPAADEFSPPMHSDEDGILFPHLDPVSNRVLPEARDEDVPTGPARISQTVSEIGFTAIEEEERLRDTYFHNWIKIRRGIMQDRLDSEKVRSVRADETAMFSVDATQRFWRNCRRKVETEVFLDELSCEWKLGVAHEGYFPSRRRIVLRPRFGEGHKGAQYSYAGGLKSDQQETNRNSMSAEELQQMLLMSSPGAIVDVTSQEEDTKEEGKGKGAGVNPGSGWGVIDADGSEEGYGVVGVAQEEEEVSPGEGERILGDAGGDMRDMAEGIRQGRDVKTGPAHSGTRRMNTDATIQEADVVLISPSGNYVGILSFTSKEIFFFTTNEHEGSHLTDSAAVTVLSNRRARRRKWLTSAVSAIYLRRYRLRDSAIEVFFSRGKHRNFFVDFGSSPEDVKRRVAFTKELMNIAPRNAFKQWPGMSMYRLVSEHGIQQQWVNGEMSNFDYLMALNTLAGRSFNDLCQYPVFPWVIAQYTKDTIDLSDPGTYRDLSKPIGALNEERLESFIERFNSFRDGDIPPFMYGSHYSTMVGVVLHFLIRLQPFASLHMEVQNGHFDVPDRLFSSIPRTWEHNTTMLSEVKELTPEWFTLPEFLKNVNDYEFGKMQSGETVGDVELPPWASSAEEFVRINREALESDYVSAHLHEWIDLIFGCKQRGPQAVEANNVFYYLTYYGAVNRELIKDEATRKAIDIQIAHFGQCPMELFRTPHPARAMLSVPRPLRRCFDLRTKGFCAPTTAEEKLSMEASCTLVNRISSARVVSMTIRATNILCVLENGVVESYRYGLSDVARLIVANGNRVESSATSGPTGGSVKRSRGRGDDWARTGEGRSIHPEGSRVTDDKDIINFDDGMSRISSSGKGVPANKKLPLQSLVLELEGTHTPTAQNNLQVRPADGSSQDIMPLTPPSHPHGGVNITRDVLLVVDRETSHFEVLPRVPLAHPRRQLTGSDPSSNIVTPSRRASTSCSQSLLPHTEGLRIFCTHHSRLILSYGRVDGGIAVREVASKQTQILSAGDFRAHRSPVTCVSGDEIPGSATDVFASCEEAGRVLVWTVSRVAKNKQGQPVKRIIISRRPQRVFICTACEESCCDLSWQMGIVVAASMGRIHVYSIERNERLHILDIYRDFKSSQEIGAVGRSYRLWHQQEDVKIRRIHLSDDGVIIVHIEATGREEDVQVMGLSTAPTSMRHFLASYSLHGVRLAVLQTPSPVTFLSCPGRGSVVISGHRDGRVLFLCAQTLDLLYEFRPHDRCLTCVLVGGGRGSVLAPEPEQAAVLCVSVGPKPKCPALVSVSTSSGAMYVRALPDFIKWDRGRIQSTLSQIVNAPIQAVKGTLQQAHHLGVVASDAAGNLATNARSFADETIAKLNRNKIFKGVVGNLFGKSSEGDRRIVESELRFLSSFVAEKSFLARYYGLDAW